jgi:hypothetical protein
LETTKKKRSTWTVHMDRSLFAKVKRLAEAEGRIKEARENEDVAARAARARAAEERTTTLESVTAANAGNEMARTFILRTLRDWYANPNTNTNTYTTNTTTSTS